MARWNRANALPIELDIGGDMTKGDRPFFDTRRELLSDGEATSFGFDVFGAPFGGYNSHWAGGGARGVIESSNTPPPIAGSLAESPGEHMAKRLNIAQLRHVGKNVPIITTDEQ
eukprot:scaffold9122_cov114-Isochrysis_galbana.AAC.1